MAEGKRGTQVSLIILITVLIFKSTSQCSQWCCLTSLHSTNTGSNGKFQFLLYYISQLKHPSILVLPTLNVNRYDNNIWYDSAWARVTFLRSFHFSLLLPLLVISQLMTLYMYEYVKLLSHFFYMLGWWRRTCSTLSLAASSERVTTPPTSPDACVASQTSTWRHWAVFWIMTSRTLSTPAAPLCSMKLLCGWTSCAQAAWKPLS